MATERLFFPAGMLLNTTHLYHVGQQSVEQNLEELVLEAAGDWAPNYTGHKKKAPEFSVESHDLTKVLDLMTSEALCASMAAANVDLYFRAGRKAAFAYGAAESQHLVYRLQSNSVVYWEQIQANQDDELKISLRVAAWNNGTNAILTALPSQTLQAPGNQVAPFTLGPIKLGNTTLTGLKGMTWANNLEVLKEFDAGGATPSAIFMRRAKPVLSFETTDPHLVHNAPLIHADGQPLDSLTVYFRRRRPNKLNYDDTDLVHAKLVADKGAGSDPVATARWTTVSEDPAKVKCEIALNRSGAAALFAYTKDCAIT